MLRHVSMSGRQPLQGVRVIDLTRMLSGPFCTMLLGDMGADVVKIEPAAGDSIRGIGAKINGMSWYFAAFNRNKRALKLDLRTEAGRADLATLIEHADVLVENFRPGVLAEMGFAPARLDALNPGLIVASINGFGSTGPDASRPAFDFIVQAMSGLMAVNGRAEDPPLRTAMPITDLLAGLYAAFGVVNALLARQHDAKGQHVEASMMDSTLSMMAYLASEQLATGDTPARTGNDHPIAAPYGLFQAADGELAIAPSTEVILRKFLRLLDLESLLDDPRFADNASRMHNRAAINEIINTRLKTQRRAHWVDVLNAAGVPCGTVQSLNEALHSPQAKAREMVIDVDHNDHGPVQMLGYPVKLSRTPCRTRHPAPDQDADRAAIWREWGLPRGLSGIRRQRYEPTKRAPAR